MKAVKDYIPHREPFLFVDDIVEIDDSYIETTFELKNDLNFFEGHYPGNPIMPGVLMCEAVFQTAGIFMAEQLQKQSCSDSNTEEKPEAKGVPILTKITNARFRRMAQPGETLTIQVRPNESQGAFHMMKGKVINSEGALVMNVDFTITLKA